MIAIRSTRSRLHFAPDSSSIPKGTPNHSPTTEVSPFLVSKRTIGIDRTLADANGAYSNGIEFTQYSSQIRRSADRLRPLIFCPDALSLGKLYCSSHFTRLSGVFHMKNQNVLIALAILFVIAVVAFTFLVPHLVPLPENPDQETPAEFIMPELTDAERDKLGPKNGLTELNWLPSNGMYGLIAYPKRLLESSLLTEGEDLLGRQLMFFMQLPLDMKKIELFLSCTSIRQAVIPPQPGEPVAPQVRPIPFPCYFIRLTEPLDKQSILNQFVPPDRGFQPPRMRIVEGKEVYDLPSAAQLPTRALVFLDEKSILYVMGNEEMLKDVLDGKAPTGPLADRMSRAKIADSDLIIVGSAEAGLPQFPPEIIEGIAKSNGLPETLVKSLFENFRAIQLTLNLSAPENESLLSLKFETLTPEGAKEITKIVNEQIVFYRSSLSLLQPRNPDTANQSEILLGDDLQKLGEQVLDSIEISSQDSVVSAMFRHFPILSTYISEFFRNQRQQIANMETQQQQQMVFESIFQRVSTVRNYMIMYHNEKGEFPPAAIRDAEGNPLLSWRVALLPYMGEKELYSQFNLEEPWDGPTNRPLIGKMPAIFSDARAYDPTRTTIRLFNSEGTPFGKPSLKMADILGPQTTIMFAVVSPENAVQWTQPDTLAPCESIEKYVQLFGPVMPIQLFDGNNTVILVGSAAEQDHAALLERLKNTIEGKPVQ